MTREYFKIQSTSAAPAGILNRLHMKKLLLTLFAAFAVVSIGIVISICAGNGFFNAGNNPGSNENSANALTSSPVKKKKADSSGTLPKGWNDNGIFSASYTKAYKKLSSMTLNEKIGQMILARCPSKEAAASIQKYHLGGFILYQQDFLGRTTAQVKSKISSYQHASSIPMLMAVDEEGGTVVRISSNPQLSAAKFKSPQQVYAQSGFSGISSDTLNKAAMLKKLGLNVNLAPVCDVSTNPSDYIYARAFGKSAAPTGKFVSTVVTAMHKTGLSSTLKHFPGYGNNKNTHTGIAIDNRSYTNFKTSDFIPFKAGISAGAESVMVAHTIVNCMDKGVPASLSPAVHRILRDDLHFTGVIMTDDLSMGAISDYTHGTDPAVKAVLAGNDMLILTDFQQGYNAVLSAAQSGKISKGTIDKAVFRILAWKYARGLLK